MSDISVIQNDLEFKMPNFGLNIDTSCCVNVEWLATLVIASVAAGYLFLRCLRSRVAFTIAVVPTVILNNGLRIYYVGSLWMHGGPSISGSPFQIFIGPQFRLLTLVLLTGLCLLLRKRDRSPSDQAQKPRI